MLYTNILELCVHKKKSAKKLLTIYFLANKLPKLITLKINKIAFTFTIPSIWQCMFQFAKWSNSKYLYVYIENVNEFLRGLIPMKNNKW